MGPKPHDNKEIAVLNRRLVWRGLITYEADTRIVGNGSKTLDAPVVVEDARGEEERS